MTLEKMIHQTFEQQTIENWQQKAEEALKGKSISTLNRHTYENIDLKPLYTKEDLENQQVSQLPGQTDFRRGSAPLGYLTEEWQVAQKLEPKEDTSLNEAIKSAMKKGQTAIAFDAEKININELKSLDTDLYKQFPFSLEGNNNQQEEILAALASLENSENISGFIAADPVADAAKQGAALDKNSLDKWAETIQSTHKAMPKLKTILVNTSAYHNAGANAVQELAIALATGVHHTAELLERKISLETILSKLVFKFSVGGNFFMEIAKLRSARLLWSKVAESFGADEQQQKMVISGETSGFTKTVYDPYVNMLRAGNEAFAAVLGGIQYLHVSPYNEPENQATSFSDRIARNTQLILKNEAHLKNIVDPAGGSWYIESLTNQLAEQAWALFLEIEEKGGITKALEAGWLQKQIQDVLNRKNKDIFTRKQSIIGTNIYASLKDTPLKAEAKTKSALPQVRLSEPYEELRIISEKISPKAGLICLGELKAHKARADFITGFLAPGGISTVRASDINKGEQAAAFAEQTKLTHYIICGSDSQYHELAAEIVHSVKEIQPNVKIMLAGLPENQESFLEDGIDQFIHLRSNCYEILEKLLSEMEAEKHD